MQSLLFTFKIDKIDTFNCLDQMQMELRQKQTNNLLSRYKILQGKYQQIIIVFFVVVCFSYLHPIRVE